MSEQRVICDRNFGKGDIGVALCRRTDGGGQLLLGMVLQHEARRSGGERTLGESGIVLHRDDNDLRLRSGAAEVADRREA